MTETLTSSPYITHEDESPSPAEAETSSPSPETESLANVSRALDRLHATEFQKGEMYPKQTLTGDGSHIEGQQLHFLKTEKGTQLTFKLTAEAYAQWAARQVEGVRTDTRSMSFNASSRHSNTDIEIMTTTVDVFQPHGVEVEVARPDQGWRALDGMVTVSLPDQHDNGLAMTGQEQGLYADTIMSEFFGIKDAFKPPEQEDDVNYKASRYAWHHRVEPGTEVSTDTLAWAEVFPGYNTVVEPGKHEEYEQRHGEFAFMHKLPHNADVLPILKQGLLSTRERLVRGIKKIGLSSETDLRKGGGDSVFTRMITEEGLQGDDDLDIATDTYLILRPELADRTDWYSFDDDKYGATDPATFATRVTPDGLLEQLNTAGFTEMSMNEQMFRTGISTEHFAGLSVGSEMRRAELIDTLHQLDIHEINNIPVEDFIQASTHLSQFIDMAHGREPRAKAVETAPVWNLSSSW